MDRTFNDTPHAGPEGGDEALIVHECEEAHYELAVHSVRYSAVTRDAVAKVFDFEGAF